MKALGGVALLLAIGMGATAVNAQTPGFGKEGRRPQQPKSEGPLPKEEKRFPLGASWIAVSLNGKPFTGSERPSFTLNEQFRATGFGGCNTFSATAFPLKEQGLAVGPLALTKRSCDKAAMATEHAFLVALRTAAKWDSQTGTLVIKSPNGELRFERSL